jgi:hypothetical protein
MNPQAIKYKATINKRELNLYYHDNNLWFTLNNISELFNCSIQKVYSALEQIVKKNRTTSEKFNKYIEITLENGAKSKGNFYNLDIIMAVGYMLNPKIAMEFYQSSLSIYKSTLLQTNQNKKGFFSRLF